jgi:hypothetical protein
MRRTTVLIFAAALSLAGCGSEDSTPESTAAATGTSSSAAPAPSGVFTAEAQDVVDAFASAGLPVTDARDNSTGGLCPGLPGCAQLVTTEDISVYVFDNEQDALGWAASNGYQRGLVVLSYSAARTPEELRPQYEQVLASL